MRRAAVDEFLGVPGTGTVMQPQGQYKVPQCDSLRRLQPSPVNRRNTRRTSLSGWSPAAISRPTMRVLPGELHRHELCTDDYDGKAAYDAGLTITQPR